MVRGRIIAPLEVPERIEALAAALARLGLVREAPPNRGRTPLLVAHPAHYLDFLERAYDDFRALPDAGPEALPNIHPYQGAGEAWEGRGPPRTVSAIGRIGWYVGDLSCAMTESTWAAAAASAQCAVAGAAAIVAGEKAAYALCRPPGHHAYADRATGFCFLNNAAIAAEILRHFVPRVAVIDFDTHHGDGTQALFYARDDVFYGSVHTDPADYYPFYSGYADEIGTGPGQGANMNLPLAPGSNDAAFVTANECLAAAVRAHGAGALVLSAGWDAHRDDPLSRLDITTAAFARIGALWGQMRLPTLIVQEGGYSLSAVMEAAPAFIAALRAV